MLRVVALVCFTGLTSAIDLGHQLASPAPEPNPSVCKLVQQFIDSQASHYDGETMGCDKISQGLIMAKSQFQCGDFCYLNWKTPELPASSLLETGSSAMAKLQSQILQQQQQQQQHKATFFNKQTPKDIVCRIEAMLGCKVPMTDGKDGACPGCKCGEGNPSAGGAAGSSVPLVPAPSNGVHRPGAPVQVPTVNADASGAVTAPTAGVPVGGTPGVTLSRSLTDAAQVAEAIKNGGHVMTIKPPETQKAKTDAPLDPALSQALETAKATAAAAKNLAGQAEATTKADLQGSKFHLTPEQIAKLNRGEAVKAVQLAPEKASGPAASALANEAETAAEAAADNAEAVARAAEAALKAAKEAADASRAAKSVADKAKADVDANNAKLQGMKSNVYLSTADMQALNGGQAVTTRHHPETDNASDEDKKQGDRLGKLLVETFGTPDQAAAAEQEDAADAQKKANGDGDGDKKADPEAKDDTATDQDQDGNADAATDKTPPAPSDALGQDTPNADEPPKKSPEEAAADKEAAQDPGTPTELPAEKEESAADMAPQGDEAAEVAQEEAAIQEEDAKEAAANK